jgi:hypothetical protein
MLRQPQTSLHCAGSPLNFLSNQSRMFAIALPANSKEASTCTWSTPIVVSYPGIPDLYINAPVTSEWIQQNLHTKTRLTASSEPCSTERCGVSCKALVRCQQEVATGDGVQLREQVVAVVRMSMQVHSPGCLHIVLHNAGGQPPFLLQNRTEEAFVVRQNKTQDQWRRLGPYSAIGFSWPFLASTLAAALCLCLCLLHWCKPSMAPAMCLMNCHLR